MLPEVFNLQLTCLLAPGMPSLGNISTVHSIHSFVQAIFVFLLLPVITSLRGMQLSELPHYLLDGKCSLRPHNAHGF